jgi:hypothetical protein
MKIKIAKAKQNKGICKKKNKEGEIEYITHYRQSLAF